MIIVLKKFLSVNVFQFYSVLYNQMSDSVSLLYVVQFIWTSRLGGMIRLVLVQVELLTLDDQTRLIHYLTTKETEGM